MRPDTKQAPNVTKVMWFILQYNRRVRWQKIYETAPTKDNERNMLIEEYIYFRRCSRWNDWIFFFLFGLECANLNVCSRFIHPSFLCIFFFSSVVRSFFSCLSFQSIDFPFGVLLCFVIFCFDRVILGDVVRFNWYWRVNNSLIFQILLCLFFEKNEHTPSVSLFRSLCAPLFSHCTFICSCNSSLISTYWAFISYEFNPMHENIS